MRVLAACEFSGTVRDAFLRRGHEAVSCDILPTESPGPHYQGDVRDILGGGWDLMIAHPDCTYLTNAAAWAFADCPMIKGKPRKMKPGILIGAERRAARKKALDFVRELMGADILRIAVENPPGAIGTNIREADQYIQPNEYGHDAKKTTGLWLKNLPLLLPTRKIEPRIVNGLPRWANQTDSGQNRLPPSIDRWKLRAKFYSGWAEVMAEQWGAL